MVSFVWMPSLCFLSQAVTHCFFPSLARYATLSRVTGVETLVSYAQL